MTAIPPENAPIGTRRPTPAQYAAFRQLIVGLAKSDPDPVVKGYCNELIQILRGNCDTAQLLSLRTIAQNTAAAQATRLRALDLLLRIFLG